MRSRETNMGGYSTGWIEGWWLRGRANNTGQDTLSFVLGMVSLVCWGVAEIPQIVTNFKSKSGHGVSLLFILTWVLGDVFNLVGCLLEPTTLPTQFYTAVLYTATTILLVLQIVYYDYGWRRWIRRPIEPKTVEAHSNLGEHKLLDDPIKSPPTVHLEVPRQGREFYYTSARSLAGSGTPPFHSFIRVPRSGPSALEVGFLNDSSSEDEATFPHSSKKTTQPWRISTSVASGTFLAASANLPRQAKSMVMPLRLEHDFQDNKFGQWLGWLMAAIYMGSRVPQIWLNIKRGSVEGLDPLMFVFAITANITYVGSILVKSTEWENIKPNMPWLLDAIVCVVLDLLIMFQYIYYKNVAQKKMHTMGDCSGNHEEGK